MNTETTHGAHESGRSYLEDVVSERACHATAEEVRTTCSFARAERMLGREYHGRFLIELLQNAADAWRIDLRSASERSRVAVVVSEGPALLVANQGAAMTPKVVIDALGHIGAGTKSEGEAIGYKGIGFKSVLEITLTPEIYSGLQEDEPGLAVSFDPQLAKTSIMRASPRWDAFVASVQGLDPNDEHAAIPILRFPHWIDELPNDVARLRDEGFDTVIRLPFHPGSTPRLRLDEQKWLQTVRNGLKDVSDEILLLLGCFSEVRIEDHLAGDRELIQPEWDHAPGALSEMPARDTVQILRDGKFSSSWRLVRRTFLSLEHLAGEIAVGIRCDPSTPVANVVPAVAGATSAPFHLYFPTRIASGLPFLVHGYFEVNAARTGFYQGSISRNQAIMAELAALVADAVCDVANDPTIALATLVDLIAGCDKPEDPLARAFREQVLERLDQHPWLPLDHGDTGPARARPDKVFVTKPELTRHVTRVFSPAYVEARIGLGTPEADLSDRALELIASRQHDQHDLWDIMGELCRPGKGKVNVWEDDVADVGFRSLLNLLDALAVEDRSRATTLIEGLRGDPDSRLLPTVGSAGGRVLLPVPDPAEGVAGRRSRLVMARARATSGDALVPPAELDLAFLPEGLLASETDVDRAKPLGVRPFTVDNVLDRLSGINESGVDPEALLRFLWRLLSRERASGFGTRRAAERAVVFDPSQWFWCRPGRAREDEATRLRQQRERYLADVPVPCRDGRWRRASSVGFGADWADWLIERADTSAATQRRISAYRAMEAISPGPHALLASPSVVVGLLGEESFTVPFVRDEADDDEPEELINETRRNIERHAFLLRLGLWEVPPIEAFESRERANRGPFPWDGPIADMQQSMISASGGWAFGLDGWGGQKHYKVHLAEDYRICWSLEDCASRDAGALAISLGLGARLYAERLDAFVFCPQCSEPGSWHGAPRYSTTAAGYPSLLALQLRHTPWVACTRDGVSSDDPIAAVAAWWLEKPPSGAGLHQSPWRLVPICGPATGITDELRRLSGINVIGDATLSAVGSLFRKLRADYEDSSLEVNLTTSRGPRQAFVGLHRLAYERIAELARSDAEDAVAAAALLDQAGVLCELGEGLVYRRPSEARHDDGRFSTYVRHFVGKVPLVVLPRDQGTVAARLGVQPFVIGLRRRGQDDGEDVTDELRSLLADRIPELLAIVVNHSLGTQTLELSSVQFEERARRLQALTVRQTPDLVIDATVDGSPQVSVTLGEGSNQDLFLENPTSVAPVLFHDLSGDGWQDRLRRKIAPYLAVLLENSAYTHTFALFLQLETDAEREEFLLELGISGDEVDAVTVRIGVVGEEERQRYLRWYRAVITALGAEASDLTLEEASLVAALTRAGLPDEVAQALVDAGGGETVRRQTDDGCPLRLLRDAGLHLASLHAELRRSGDTGLAINASSRSFAGWIDAHGRRVSAVLARCQLPDLARSSVRALEPPVSLALTIDPPMKALLGPVADLLASAGLTTSSRALALDPPAELMRVGGFDSVEALDADVRLLFDEDEQRRMLRERAAQWRREIRLLAVLTRMGPAETRSTVRSHDDAVCLVLPVTPSLPSGLVEAVDQLFFEHVSLKDWLANELTDSILGQGPHREDLLKQASALGVAVEERLPVLLRALDTPRRDHARAIKARSDRLHSGGLTPAPPAGLAAPPPPRPPQGAGRKRVAMVKVEESHDRRKRELGDEGEQWALAAIIGQLLRASRDERDQAIDEVEELLRRRFKGRPVDAALVHAPLARSRDIDDEELVDELNGLLHVSRHSDAFGFDLVGWLAVSPGIKPTAICLEVKSTGDQGFHLSSSEWSLAERFHSDDEGDRYAVLAVRRGGQGGLPMAMDLLVDPVSLHKSHQLAREADGYKLSYRLVTDDDRGESV